MKWQPPTTSAATPDATPGPHEVWLPEGLAAPRSSFVKALINIIGVSGVGKSFLACQALEDLDYGPDEVAVLMHEDATAAYGPLMKSENILRATTPDEADKIVERMIEGHKKGYRLPKLLFWDSLTGMTDYFQADKEANPNMTQVKVDGKPTGEWARDKRSEYGDMGRWAQRLFLKLRDQLPMDVVVLITSYEDNYAPRPEIACEGKVIPKNITRWSSCTLYMKAVEGKIDLEKETERKELEAEIKEGGRAHRSYGRTATGALDGTFLSRYFICQNTGEITAKGHRNLGLRECAILPDVLRKIRGLPART
jgi:hypothetical protein